MDALVAQYSRPAFENEGYSLEEQQELSEATPPLSLKFALPPIASVSYTQIRSVNQETACSSPVTRRDKANTVLSAFCLPSSNNRRSCQPKLPYQTCTRYHNPSIPLPRRHHSRHGFKSHGRKLDRESNSQESHRDQQLPPGDHGGRSSGQEISI